MRGPSKFRQSEVERVVRAVQHSGLRIAGVVIGRDGSIQITTGKPQDDETDAGDKVAEDIVL